MDNLKLATVTMLTGASDADTNTLNAYKAMELYLDD